MVRNPDNLEALEEILTGAINELKSYTQGGLAPDTICALADPLLKLTNALTKINEDRRKQEYLYLQKEQNESKFLPPVPLQISGTVIRPDSLSDADLDRLAKATGLVQ